jgi:oligopeptide transport system permease protein
MDLIILRLIDVFQSIPTLVLMTLVMMLFSTHVFFESDHLTRLIAIIFSLSLVSWINVARVVRTQVMQMKAMTFVEAARSAGGSGIGIFRNHILRNIWGPIAVMLAYQVPSNILFESFLSFIGLGLQPPYSSWGVLANEGWRSLRSYPHLILFPGIFLFLTTLSFNTVADGLRDRFDPKFR